MGLKEDLQNIFTRFSNNIVEKLDEIKPKEVQIVIVKQNPDTYSITEIDKKTTTNTKWTVKDKPIMQFKNVLEKQGIVKEISLRPDTNFKTKGKAIITVDDSEVFISKSFTSFEDIIDTTIPVNKTIEQDSKVKIFMISSDGTAVGLTAQVTFGD